MTLASLAEYSESQQRGALRALDKLDRLETRLDAHYSGKRQHARRSFRGVATIRCPAGVGGTAEFTVWTRSISESGLSFISPEPIKELNVLVGLHTAPNRTLWFHAEIVRSKAVPEETFWEHGVAFRGRVKD